MGRATPAETTKAIAYYRVSTTKQGESGLGLDAQRDSVQRFAQARGLQLAGEFTEIETGTNKRERPQLTQAIALAKRENARLLIAKLDRLTRNVHFLTGLQDAHVQFTAVDMPEADEFTVQILAAVAQREAKLISERTRAALAAVKRRGVTLGKPENMKYDAQLKGAHVQREAAKAAYSKVVNYARMLQKEGLTYEQIAERLNAEGHTTRTGGQFKPMTVWRMVKRAG
jgi:DNA invertase Pin-like site-specific DNA recombinase